MRSPGIHVPGGASPSEGAMTSEIPAAETRTDAKNLLTLAGRMSIPADEAIRQIAQLVADADRPAGVRELETQSGKAR